LGADQHGALRAYALATVTRKRILVSAVAEAAEKIKKANDNATTVNARMER
jgi:hypothetical protein